MTKELITVTLILLITLLNSIPTSPNNITEVQYTLEGDLSESIKTIPLEEIILYYGDLFFTNPDKILLPPGYTFQPDMIVMGDLNGNGLDDLAIVITEYITNDNGNRFFGYRHLYILLAEPGGGFKIGWYSADVMMHAMGAGRFVDGFVSINIKDGVLNIEHIWGSAWSAQGIVSYAIRDDELILIREETTNWHSAVGNWYTEIYYPKTGRVEIFTALPIGETLTGDEGQRLVLFSHTTTPGRIYEFSADIHQENARGRNRGWRDDIEWQHARMLFHWGPLDHMYFQFPFGSIDLSMINISACEALSMVQAKYYPEFTRVEFLLAQEIMESFDIIAGYQIPRHFYAYNQQILMHRASSQIRGISNILHYIELREAIEDNWGFWKTVTAWITVNDNTGAITIM